MIDCDLSGVFGDATTAYCGSTEFNDFQVYGLCGNSPLQDTLRTLMAISNIVRAGTCNSLALATPRLLQAEVCCRTYISPRIQNGIINACNDLILEGLIDSILFDLVFFSVVADETIELAYHVRNS